MGIDTLRAILFSSLIAALPASSLPAHSNERAELKVAVQQTERVGRDKVRIWLKVANASGRPVFLAGTHFESGPIPELVSLERRDAKEGWMSVGLCADTPPPAVIRLNPGESITFALDVPRFQLICKVREIQLEGTFRIRLEYFESEKQARTYVKKLFSSRWREARAPVAVSEPFEIPPTPTPER